MWELTHTFKIVTSWDVEGLFGVATRPTSSATFTPDKDPAKENNLINEITIYAFSYITNVIINVNLRNWF